MNLKISKKKTRDCIDKLIAINDLNINSESVNHVLKQTIDWKSKRLTDLVDALFVLIKGQFKDLRAALFGTGEFRLSNTHSRFSLTKTDWVSMTNDQRTRHYSRFRNYKVIHPSIVTSTNGLATVVAPKTHGKKPGQRKRKVNERTTTVTKRKTCE